MYYSTIGLLAVMILLIENHDILSNPVEAFQRPAWKVYRRFLFAVLAYYVTDILWGMLESRKWSVLLFTDTTVYFVAMAAGVLFWARFTVAYLEEQTGFGKALVVAGQVVAGIISFLAVVNIFTPVLFTVDAGCVYRALPVRYVMLVCQIALLLLISAYASSDFSGRRKRGKRNRTLTLFGLLMAVFLFAQLWLPYYPLYAIAYMLGTCLLHTFILNDVKDEYKRGLDEAEKTREMHDTIVSLMDNMPAIAFAKDAQTGVYIACNQAFAEYAEKENPAAVIGLTDAQMFDEETAKHFVDEDKIALSMDRPYVFYEEAMDAAGNRRHMQTTKLKYHNLEGVLCVLGMCQDMTNLVRIPRESAATREDYEKAHNMGVIYNYFAQSLTRGYGNMLYVNLDSEEFIEYRSDDSGALTEVRRGWHFFEECQEEAESRVHPDDCAAFIKAMDRKTLEAALDRNKAFVMTFRAMTKDGPRYVTMKVSRMEDDERRIILGFTDVDEQMKERRAADRAREEKTAYARLNALSGDYICVYVVDPKTGRYREFSSARSFEAFEQAKEGTDFFNSVREAARRFNHPEDLNRFLSAFTRENVLAEIDRRGIFTLSYRLMVEGNPIYVQLKAAMVEEKDGPRMIVGVNDIDAQVRQEEAYVKQLAQARMDANVCPLTGVKNKHAYLEAEERLNIQIAEKRAPEFAVVLLDVNDLKKVNDTIGHKAGDQYLRDACKIVCTTFKHSPVFRIGGDEFAVISQGGDYARIGELVEQMAERNEKARRDGGIVIACGMARHEGEESVASVFERADQNMYEDKSRLKDMA